ncbi:hypothetical protein DFS34DRAFT_61648 [Phlyctochytrium arcticum]|nr:hypothetical protein DFS34DRAFT_61648 [Phlyctochytrium arcticum]
MIEDLASTLAVEFGRGGDKIVPEKKRDSKFDDNITFEMHRKTLDMQSKASKVESQSTSCSPLSTSSFLEPPSDDFEDASSRGSEVGSLDITDLFGEDSERPRSVHSNAMVDQGTAHLAHQAQKQQFGLPGNFDLRMLSESAPPSATNLDDIINAADEGDRDPFSKAFATAAETSQTHLPGPALVVSPDSTLQNRKRQSLRRLFRPRSASSSTKVSPVSVESLELTNSQATLSPFPHDAPSFRIDTLGQDEETTIVRQTTGTNKDMPSSAFPNSHHSLALPSVRRRSHVYSQRRSISHADASAENAPLDLEHLAACDSDDSVSAKSSPFDIKMVPFDDNKPHLDVSSRNLSHFPRLPKRFAGLTEVHFVNNWITAIPGTSLAMLKRLQVLDLSQNLLHELPAELGLLKELRELYVRENRLEIIPEELSNCHNLQVIDLARNRLKNISPTIFSNMKRLTNLDLSHNNLRMLPSSLGVLKDSLLHLHVDNNNFDSSFQSLITPLVAAMRQEFEHNVVDRSPSPLPGSETRPAENSVIIEKETPVSTVIIEKEEAPDSKEESRSSTLDGKRIRSLPPGGLSQAQFAKLETLFAGGGQTDASKGSLRSKSGSHKVNVSGRQPVTMIGAQSEPKLRGGRDTNSGSFRMSSGSMRSRLGLVGAFVGSPEPIASPEEADGQKKDDSDPNHTVDKKGRIFGMGSIGMGSKRRSRIPTIDLPSSSAKTDPPIVSESGSIPTVHIGPRSSSLDMEGARDSTCLQIQPSPRKPSANRNRFSLFGGKPPVNGGSEVSSSNGPTSRIYLHRLLNHLRDAHELDPRANGANVEVLSCQTIHAPTDEEQDAKQAERLKKKQTPERRRKVSLEILTTERTYVQQLEALVEVYIKPIEERGILTVQESNTLFSNVKNILIFHQEHLLPDLEEGCKTEEQCLGPVFFAGAPFLRMYSVYYNNFDAANSVVYHLEAQVATGSSPVSLPSPAVSASTQPPSQTIAQRAASKARAKQFRDFSIEVKKDPRHTQNSLQSFLILPVQRLPRYKLLVDELLECTPPEHPDYHELRKAREEVRRRVEECNEKKREWEARERGLNVLLRVRVKPWSSGAETVKHVRPGRKFLREGELKVLKSVEFVGAATGGTRINALQACGGKKDRFKQSVLGHLIETRFGARGNDTLTENTKADKEGDALTSLRLNRTVGKTFQFYLFSDVLCWCRAKAGSDGEHELIRGIDLASTDENAVEMTELIGISKEKDKREAVLRIRDRECVVYFRGPFEEISSWLESIKGRAQSEGT